LIRFYLGDIDLETVTKRLYESLFLVDSAEAAADWAGINEHIKKLLERNGAEVVSIRKWDERPLAYPIMGKNRGTYILAYFNSPSGAIAAIERDCQLSERIMRVLILRADHITKEDIEKETPAMIASKPVHKPAEVVEEVPPITSLDEVEGLEDEDVDEPEPPA
jgi:small subunit ribosomal protein S6